VRHGYASYLHDPAIPSHCYVRHRWYDTTRGYWLSRDPLGYVDGMNLYQYVSGRPVVYADPFGHHVNPPGYPYWKIIDFTNRRRCKAKPPLPPIPGGSYKTCKEYRRNSRNKGPNLDQWRDVEEILCTGNRNFETYQECIEHYRDSILSIAELHESSAILCYGQYNDCISQCFDAFQDFEDQASCMDRCYRSFIMCVVGKIAPYFIPEDLEDAIEDGVEEHIDSASYGWSR
jgi:RHS repeat-associated protein